MLQASSAATNEVLEAAKSLEYFEQVRIKIESVAEYPYFTRMISLLGLCFSPTALSVVFGILKTMPSVASHLSVP